MEDHTAEELFEIWNHLKGVSIFFLLEKKVNLINSYWRTFPHNYNIGI